MITADIDSTLRVIDDLWPDRFAAIHNEGLRNQLAGIRCDSAQARVALQQVWAEKGRYAEPARMLEALRNIGRSQVSAPDPKVEWRARQAAAESEAQRDDRLTLAWLDALDQQDIDTLAAHVMRTCGPIGGAFLRMPGGKVTKEHAMTRPSVRGVLHAAERQLVASASWPSRRVADAAG